MTTEGHEDAILIGRGAQWVDGRRVAERRNLAVQNKPHPLIERSMIVGIRERIDSTGTIIRPLDEEDVRRKLKHLIDRGARAIVVSLLWSIHELRERAPGQGDHPRGIQGVSHRLSAGGAVEPGRRQARRVRAHHDGGARRLSPARDADRALRHLGQDARGRVSRQLPHGAQFRRQRRDLQDHRPAAPSTAVRSPG